MLLQQTKFKNHLMWFTDRALFCVKCQVCTQLETFPYCNAVHQQLVFTKPCSVLSLDWDDFIDFVRWSQVKDRRQRRETYYTQGRLTEKEAVNAAGTE